MDVGISGTRGGGGRESAEWERSYTRGWMGMVMGQRKRSRIGRG